MDESRLALYRVQLAIGWAGWVIYPLAAILMGWLLRQLTTRRSDAGILLYFLASCLPLLAGLCGSTTSAMATFSQNPSTGNELAAGLSQAAATLLVGAVASFFLVLGACLLALMGPSGMPGDAPEERPVPDVP